MNAALNDSAAAELDGGGGDDAAAAAERAGASLADDAPPLVQVPLEHPARVVKEHGAKRAAPRNALQVRAGPTATDLCASRLLFATVGFFTSAFFPLSSSPLCAKRAYLTPDHAMLELPAGLDAGARRELAKYSPESARGRARPADEAEAPAPPPPPPPLQPRYFGMRPMKASPAGERRARAERGDYSRVRLPTRSTTTTRATADEGSGARAAATRGRRPRARQVEPRPARVYDDLAAYKVRVYRFDALSLPLPLLPLSSFYHHYYYH